MKSLLDQVEVREAGKLFIVSGTDEMTVNYVMDQLRSDGAHNATRPVKVGSKWIATFDHPLLKECRTIKEGYRITAIGPNADIVTLYADQYIERGAIIEAGPIQVGDKWELYLYDEAARTRTTFFT